MRGNRQCQSSNNRSQCRLLFGGRNMAGNHPRNTGPMLASRRCGAKTRSGKPCMAPAVSGKERCRMHGGAQGSGAPRGNKNALKHGRYTRQAIAERRLVRRLIRQSLELIQKIKFTLDSA
jgi:glucans biosynthesis protein